MGVMNVKRTTTIASGDHSGGGSAASRSPDAGASNISAMDEQKALGGQNIGDVLNKLSDSNYVDPSKKHRAAGNAQLDKDAFMKLMLTQMKYQDPQNPMQSHEMAAQLAQFTSLEQLNNIHTTLESMKTAQSPAVNYQALNFIGKKIASDSSRITRVAGDTNHSMTFQLLGDAAKTKITIKDAAGNSVRKLDIGALKKGANAVSWNGLTDEGVAARPGEYKMAVEAESSAGTKVYAKTQLEGRITGLNYTPEGPILMVGDQSVKMSDVKKIEEAPPDASMLPLGATSAAGISPGALSALGEAGGAMNAKDAILQSVQKGAGLSGMMPTATEAVPMRAPVSTQLGAQGAQAKSQLPRMSVKPESKGLAKSAQEDERNSQARVKVQAESKANDRAKIEAEPKVAANSDHGVKSESLHQDSKPSVSNETINVPPAEESTAPLGNIDSVPMAQGLMNKLAQSK